MRKKNIGSDFNEFLREEGIYEEVHAAALKEVFATELRRAMTRTKVSEKALAARMGTKGRSTVRRLLDPKNSSATLLVMTRAASAVGLELGVTLKRKAPLASRARRTRASAR
jgi:antitoxin HicB